MATALHHSSTHSAMSTGSIFSRRSSRSALSSRSKAQRRRMDAAALLIDRLLRFLHACPDLNIKSVDGDDLHSADISNTNTNTSIADAVADTASQGLALPADAVSWLAVALEELRRAEGEVEEEEYEDEDDMSYGTGRMSTISAISFGGMISVSNTFNRRTKIYTEKLKLLRTFLPRATHLRVTADVWPPKESNTDAPGGKLVQSMACAMIPNNVVASSYDDHYDDNDSRHSYASSAAPWSDSTYAHGYRSNCATPRVDVSIFPNLSVLLLDGVPPEWMCNFDMLRPRLRLLRVERGAVFNVNSLLFPDDDDRSSGSGSDGVSGIRTTLYPRLTHLKLSKCAIGELSGLLGRNGDRNNPRIPPLSRLPRLTTISLANNELIRAPTALAGVKNLPKLKRIDLSNNRIASFKNAYFVLGNVKVLLLSHNRISNLRGIDRLFSIEHLALDYNELQELSNVVPLTKLPFLNAIELDGNPFVKTQSSYRIQVLHMFQQSRARGVTPAEQVPLPSLDRKAASEKELEALRNHFFSRVMTQDVSAHSVSISSVESSLDTDPSFSVPRTSKVVRISGTASAHIREVKPLELCSHDADDGFCTIDCVFEPEFSVVEVISCMSIKTKSRLFSRANRMKYIRSLRTKTNAKSTLKGMAPNRLADMNEELIDDVFAPDDNNHDTDAKASSPSRVDSSCVESIVVEAADPMNEQEPYPHDIGEPSIMEEAESEGAHELSYKSVKIAEEDIKNEGEDTIKVGDDTFDEEKSIGEAIMMPLEKEDRILFKMPIPVTATQETKLNSDTVSMLQVRQFKAVKRMHSKMRDVSQGESNPAKNDIMALLNKIDGPRNPENEDNITRTAESMLPRTSKQKQNKLEYLLGRIDETKVEPREDNNAASDILPVSSKLHLQESSVEKREYSNRGAVSFSDGHDFLSDQHYDGPIQHAHLVVTATDDNLRLYFRTQLFGIPAEDDFEEQPLRPRILVHRLDKVIGLNERRKKGLDVKTEAFVDLWRVDLLACGRQAVSRLPPKLSTTKKADGEDVTSEDKYIADSRRVIACISDEGLYLIPDEYIDVTDDAPIFRRGRDNRKFPEPIHPEALFNDGYWAHAFARHPFDLLVRITIGFQFERLALHFDVPATSSKDGAKIVGNEMVSYTYVLLTRSKHRTMSILRALQIRAREAKIDTMSIGNVEDGFIIENDDQFFLDAINNAVSPMPPGTVLHYKLLYQQWGSKSKRYSVRRACVVTDEYVFLLDEHYYGDGCKPSFGQNTDGSVGFQCRDFTPLKNISEVCAANVDPRCIKIVVKSGSYFRFSRSWRLLCSDGRAAEELVENVRRAMTFATRFS